MRWWHWILVVAVFYEGLIGLSEVLSTTSPANNPLASLASFPSIGSFVQSSTSVSNTVAGGVDLGVALVIYFMFLHMRIF